MHEVNPDFIEKQKVIHALAVKISIDLLKQV